MSHWFRIKPKQLGLVISAMLVIASLSACASIPKDSLGYYEVSKEEVISANQFSIKKGVFRAELSDRVLELSFPTTDTVRVTYLKKDEKPSDTLVISPDLNAKQDFHYSFDQQTAELETDLMKVKLSIKDGLLSFYDGSGKLLVSEPLGESYNKDLFSLTLAEDKPLYGVHGYDAWENSEDLLLRNAGGIVKAGQQGNAGGPFVWTTGGFGLLFDSASGRMTVKDQTLQYQHSSVGGKDYFLMVGSPKSIFKALSIVSGQSPMSPKWALGFHHSEWGVDEAEMLATAATYREKGLALDNYILDFDWKAWGEDQYGEWRWNEAKFPSGPSGKLAQTLGNMGIHMSGIMKPRIHVKTIQGQYAQSHDYWYPKRLPSIDYFSKQLVNGLDFAKKEVREWYYKHNKNMYQTGFAGYWNDEADEGYDSFAHLNMQRAMYEGLRADTKERVWSINRNYYLGAQRYAYGLWSGDVNSGFDAMKAQRERMLSAANLGAFKWGMDTGGFNGDDPSPENYARWIQFSAMSPIFRVHGREDHERQPWAFGSQAEVVARNAMNLRYSLLPYIYSYEYQLYSQGIGLVRPLAMMYPEDLKAANVVDGWMFGDFLYTAPVVDEGQTQKTFYLPKGDWVPYGGGETISGGKEISIPVDAKTWSDIPLYIKTGAIIPTQVPQRYIGEKPVTEQMINIYPSKTKTSFDWYDDDGSTYSYETGGYLLQRMTQEQNGKTLIVNFERPSGQYVSETKTFKVRIRTKSVKAITMDGYKLELTSGKDSMGVFYEVSLPAGKSAKLSISLK